MVAATLEALRLSLQRQGVGWAGAAATRLPSPPDGRARDHAGILPRLSGSPRQPGGRRLFRRQVCADGWKAGRTRAPYDAVMLAAAAPQFPATQQLADGGRLVPLGDQVQMLTLYESAARNASVTPLSGKIRTAGNGVSDCHFDHQEILQPQVATRGLKISPAVEMTEIAMTACRGRRAMCSFGSLFIIARNHAATPAGSAVCDHAAGRDDPRAGGRAAV
ncbi:hypothetical protein HS125_20100 [bacterium]|nr:hypothetical protein [bacterium]